MEQSSTDGKISAYVFGEQKYVDAYKQKLKSNCVTLQVYYFISIRYRSLEICKRILVNEYTQSLNVYNFREGLFDRKKASGRYDLLFCHIQRGRHLVRTQFEQLKCLKTEYNKPSRTV